LALKEHPGLRYSGTCRKDSFAGALYHLGMLARLPSHKKLSQRDVKGTVVVGHGNLAGYQG
jgi:hypothetical protein